MSDPKSAYVAAHGKSKGVSLVLTILFGPLGLLYTRWLAALILLVLSISLFTTVIVPVLCWIISIIMGHSGVDQYNQRLQATADLMAGRTE
jgi:ABC-type transport system involved in multi-copper enzyme maturation permease subunit